MDVQTGRGRFISKTYGYGFKAGRSFCKSFAEFQSNGSAFGVACGVGFRLIVYFKAKNAKKFRHGVEYGSARCGIPVLCFYSWFRALLSLFIANSSGQINVPCLEDALVEVVVKSASAYRYLIGMHSKYMT